MSEVRGEVCECVSELCVCVKGRMTMSEYGEILRNGRNVFAGAASHS